MCPTAFYAALKYNTYTHHLTHNTSIADGVIL